MIYTYGMKGNDSLCLEIDAKEFLHELECYFEIVDYDELSLKVKQVVKTPKDFYALCDFFEIKDKEMFVLLQAMFEEVFNKRLLTSLHKIYKVKGNLRK